MDYIGIDIGGTSVKGMVIDEKGKNLAAGSVATVPETLAENIGGLVEKLISDANIKNVVGVGIGCPGTIDSAKGIVVCAENLNYHNYPLVKKLKEHIDFPIKITNDANAAALGEARFGSGSGYRNCVLITLGTGVGGGVIIDGKLFEGGKSAGAELGHMVISYGGKPCSCGRLGCFEAYSSATALIRATKDAMTENPYSLLWEVGSLDNVTGKTAFDYAPRDKVAKRVVLEYISHLGCGLTNIANIFRPEVIMIGGGVSLQGKVLSEPLQNFVNNEIFGAKENYAPVKITCATLGIDAGVYGAAALFM